MILVDSYQEGLPLNRHQSEAVAYFSMEIALSFELPTYSGGLGVLAGDTLRSAADLGIDMVAVSLLYRKGYFKQSLDEEGTQSESPAEWDPSARLTGTNITVTINIEGHPVDLKVWRYSIHGTNGHAVPVFLLDSDLPQNSPWARSLSDSLYSGDLKYRLAQEMVLGLGGIAALRALGYRKAHAYHMNEGHAALLSVALAEELAANRGDVSVTEVDWDSVRSHCVFTTHTPVPAGHDVFPGGLVASLLGSDRPAWRCLSKYFIDGALNMTALALHSSRFVNGVAMRHAQVSRSMFPEWAIDSITNGVHAATWASPAFQRMFDAHIPEWRRDNFYLRYVKDSPLDAISAAHAESKQAMLDEVRMRTGTQLDPDACTIVFARRATAYKRMALLFTDLARLAEIARTSGPVQVVLSGKAHPADIAGKSLIHQVHSAGKKLADRITVVYLPDYDMALAAKLCAGADVWLNTPQPPYEASGTSGIKAAINGVPSLSTMDGWWIEGHVEGVTGWAIGTNDPHRTSEQDAEDLYDKLQNVVLPTFYGRPEEFAAMQRNTIALNGSFFTAQRMIAQYAQHAYRRTELA